MIAWLDKKYGLWPLFAVCIALAGCSSGGDFADIDEFMAKTKAQPQGVIEPMPVFKPYKAFRYNAASLRAPFDVPVKIKEIALLSMSSDVQPDFTRVKEQLEGFNIEALSMVGTLERGGSLWALIDDGEGGVHQVLPGNYLGKNHGRIIEIELDSISVLEIMSNGQDSWIERPRTLRIKDGG